MCLSDYPKQGFSRHFLHFVFPRLQKSEKNFFLNMQPTIIDVKFDEEFKSEIIIGLPRKENLGNCNNLSKNEGKFQKIVEKCI